MKHQLLLSCFLLPLFLFSQQKREEMFDYSFRPVKAGGYFYVVTEKQDSLFHRQAWYLSQKTTYMDGWYGDENCKTAHGGFKWYHPNGYLRETGQYLNGKKEGVWLRFDDEGRLTDSLNYADGWRKGIGLSWHKNGYLSDSTNFDGVGNGVEVRWHDDGTPAAAGYWTQDTLKRGRWKYFDSKGNVKATEEYDNGGRLAVCYCNDEQGQALDTALCREKEAVVDKLKWRRHLENSLQPLVEQKAKEGISGSFTVAVRFLVEKDGSISDVKALTNYGHGIEEGVVKIIQSGPAWLPGRYQGRVVRSYHTQPVTFVIQ